MLPSIDLVQSSWDAARTGGFWWLPTIHSLPFACLAQVFSSSLLATPGLIGGYIAVFVVAMPVPRHDLVTSMTPDDRISM